MFKCETCGATVPRNCTCRSAEARRRALDAHLDELGEGTFRMIAGGFELSDADIERATAAVVSRMRERLERRGLRFPSNVDDTYTMGEILSDVEVAARDALTSNVPDQVAA